MRESAQIQGVLSSQLGVLLCVYACCVLWAWWPSGAGLCLMIQWVMSLSPTTHGGILSNPLSLPPTTPTSPPSCEWVPGVSWGANLGLNSSGPGGTSGAHTTYYEKVAGPPASF